jgi:hypothetical protein
LRAPAKPRGGAQQLLQALCQQVVGGRTLMN